MFLLYVLYVDDSGSTRNTNEQYLVLGGVAVFERQSYHITKAMDSLAELLCPTAPRSVEFHASEIFRGKEAPWSALKSRSDRQQVIKDVLAILARDTYGLSAFAVAVHKPSFPREDPMELAFEELCNRFDLYLKRKHNSGDTQRGIIIFDESTYENELQELAHKFRTEGTRWGVTRNMSEVPLFVDSRASRCIQLADHIAYAVFRRYESGDTNYLDPIVAKFDENGGRIHGLVHKQTMIANCRCAACLSRLA